MQSDSNGWRTLWLTSSKTASSRISACEKSVMEHVNEDNRTIENPALRPQHKYVWANLLNLNMV